MEAFPLVCTKCQTPVPGEQYSAREPVPCGGCGSPLAVTVFPSFHVPVRAGKQAEAVLAGGTASCFYHPEKRAVVPCVSCGRFLCALCDVELKEEHFCTGCLERGKRGGKLADLETDRTLFDSVALSLAVLPLLLFWVTIVTAPMALFVAIRYWRAPSSILPRTRVRMVFAILLASLQIAAWVFGITFLITRYWGVADG